jgi:acetolactate synthase-1/2/3 large subunit
VTTATAPTPAEAIREALGAPDAAPAYYFPGTRRAQHDGRAWYGRPASGARLVVEFMKVVGVDVIFGIPGGASLPLTDALTAGHVEGAFRYVLTGHEQGAAFEAEGYAAASGRCGFCTATSGPGATNLITGLADAFRDSRPVLALTGNTATTAEREAFQAIDIVGITHGKATKASFRPERPEDVQFALVAAYHTAVTGRPGSVLVDLPRDVQVGTAVVRPWEEFVALLDWAPPRADDGAVGEAARRLAAAARPVIYAGHGATLAGAAPELRRLSRRFGIPVATTVHGLGLMEAGDPLNLGMLGMHGSVAANLAPYLSDLTLAVGARFDDRVVGARPAQFAPEATVIHVDVDHRQLNRVRQVDLAVLGDVKDFLRRLLEHSALQRHPDRGPWLAQLDAIQRAMPTPSYDVPGSDVLSHEYVYAELAAALAAGGHEDVVVTFDVGTHQMKGAQWFPVSRPRSFITSGGMGSMGCAIPMATGAALARQAAPVVAAVGDGGFVMSAHELDTIGSYQFPVKIVLFDDAALGMVTNWHHLFYEGRYLTSDRRRGRPGAPLDLAQLKRTLCARVEGAGSADEVAAAICEATIDLARAEWPLFAAVAAGYGIPAERVHTKPEWSAAARRMLAADGPYLVQVMLPAQNQVFPLIKPGTTPQDLVWRETSPGSGEHVYVRDRFDYESRCLR